MNDDMMEKAESQKRESELKIKMAQEMIARAYKASLAKIGRAVASVERHGLKLAIEQHNKIMGSQIRLSIPTIDGMLLCITSIPGKVGTDIFSRPSFIAFTELLYAVRELMVEERDAEIKAKTNL